MKNFLKLFFIVGFLSFSVLFGLITKSRAEYVRTVGIYAKGTNCPDSGNTAYASICGRVTQAGPTLYEDYGV